MPHTTRQLAIVILAATAALPAQLSGDYTIDPTGTGTRNFKSFAAAAVALQTKGVKAAVRFAAAMSSHQESWKLGPVAGTNSTSTITFRAASGGTKLTAATLPIITLNRAHFVAFEGFEMSHVGSTSGFLLYLLTSDYLNVRNCSFSTTGRVWGIWGQGRGWSVHDNRFVGNGIWGGGVQPPCRVFQNRFTCIRTQGNPAVSMSGSVYNNVFVGTTSSSTRGCAAEVFAYNCDFWHNTISVETSGAGIRTNFVSTTTTGSSTILNNIIDVRGVGVGIEAYSSSSTAILVTELDYNLYSVASGNIGSFRGTLLNSLSSWQGATSNRGKKQHYDRNSRLGDPRFVSVSDVHLRFGSAAIDYALVQLQPASRIGSSAVPVDRDGIYRGNMRDIGAHEFAGHRFYGSGCPGTARKTPFLDVQGDIGPGKFARFAISGARPSGGFFAFGLKQTAIPLGGSCRLLTDSLLVFFVPVSAAGTSSVRIQLPLNQPTGKPDVFLQFGAIDPGAGGSGLAMSRGVRVHL